MIFKKTASASALAGVKTGCTCALTRATILATLCSARVKLGHNEQIVFIITVVR